MLRLSLIIAAAGACVSLANAQGFNTIVGTPELFETANGIDHTRDGGWVTVGTISDIDPVEGRTDVLVVKYRRDGAVEWSMRYGNDQDEVGYSIRQTRDEGYIVGAERRGIDQPLDLMMFRLDSTGGLQWAWTHVGDDSNSDIVHGPGAGVSVREVRGGYCLTGRFVREGRGQNGQFIYTDDSGNPYYNNSYSDASEPDRSVLTFSDAVQNPRDASFAVVGTKRVFRDDGTVSDEPMLIRIERSGNPLFAVQFRAAFADGTEYVATGDGLTLTPEGDVVFSGRNNLGRRGLQNLHAVRVDSNFSPVWSQLQRDAGSAYRSIFIENERQISIGGWNGRFPDSSSAQLLLLDFGGSPITALRAGLLTSALGMVPSPQNPAGGHGLCGTLRDSVLFQDNIELIHADASFDTGCLSERFQPELQEFPLERVRWAPSVESLGSEQIDLPQERVELRQRTACDEIACPQCAADYNQDGGVDGSDVEAFFTEWAAGAPCADVDQSGGVDGSDVATFFTVWSAGGC